MFLKNNHRLIILIVSCLIVFEGAISRNVHGDGEGFIIASTTIAGGLIFGTMAMGLANAGADECREGTYEYDQGECGRISRGAFVKGAAVGAAIGFLFSSWMEFQSKKIYNSRPTPFLAIYQKKLDGTNKVNHRASLNLPRPAVRGFIYRNSERKNKLYLKYQVALLSLNF